jgi:hypothetical protein
MDFNVMGYTKFTDKVFDSTLQLIFRNYYLSGFGVVSKNNIQLSEKSMSPSSNYPSA